MTINILALAVMIFIVWWFWLSKPRTQKAGDHHVVEVIAENGTYEPPVIEAQRGRPLVLRFIRKDPSPCAEKVQFEKLNIYSDLEVGKPKDIVMDDLPRGEYEFTCQMGMYRGKLIVE